MTAAFHHFWKLILDNNRDSLFVKDLERILMKERIVEEKVEIDYKKTKEFFEHRGKNKQKLEHNYNYVLFQDDHPELALERDQKEKQKILPYFFQADKTEKEIPKNALDIGCGVGRWGEELVKHKVHYVGIDYSEHLLSIAKETLAEAKNQVQLIHGEVQKLLEVLEQEQIKPPFDFILINGVLMYLNDKDLIQVLESVSTLIGENTILYIKETVSKEQRLTLNEFYSKELTQNYSVIYRYVGDYTTLIEEYFKVKGKMKWIAAGELYEDELKNRKETVDYFYLLKK